MKKFNSASDLRIEKTIGLVDRLLVVEILDSVFIRKETTKSFFLKNQKELLDVKSEELAYANRASKQILKNLNTIDNFFLYLLRSKTEKTILNILRLAIFQIYFEGRQPYACVDSAVKLTKFKLKKNKAPGYVNAILRSVLRSQNNSKYIKKRESVAFYKTELSQHFSQTYGKREQKKTWDSLKNDPPIDLTIKDRNQIEIWEKKLNGIRIANSNTIRLKNKPKISDLPGYKDGAWWVQNYSASLPVLLLGNIQNLDVLDCCAAPGGKTMQLSGGGAKTTSLDISKKRVESLRENLERTGLQSTLLNLNLFKFLPKKLFDAVLLDAPCSSTGTLRKNPEIEYLDPMSRMHFFSALQKKMLKHVRHWVRPGGRIVFSTCSLSPTEGSEIVLEFLRENKNFKIENIDCETFGLNVSLKDALGGLRINPYYLSDIGGVDGFYIAVLKKQQ